MEITPTPPTPTPPTPVDSISFEDYMVDGRPNRADTALAVVAAVLEALGYTAEAELTETERAKIIDACVTLRAIGNEVLNRLGWLG